MKNIFNNTYDSFSRYFISCLLIYFFSLNTSLAQFYFFDDAQANIELEFAKPKIELKAKSSFFNVLTIMNSSEHEQPIIINLAVPEAWNLIGDDVIHLKLGPLDTVKIPVRVALSKQVKGEIGYAVVATITDDEGNVIKSVQSFIHIPRESDLLIKPLSRTNYFDQKTGRASVNIKIENKGNSDEIVNMEMKTESGIIIPGEVKNIYAFGISLAPFTDTIVQTDVFLNSQDNLNKSSYGIELKAYYQDTAFSTSIWFKKLDNSYSSIIPEGKKPLIVEVSAQNLFSDFESNYASNIKGTVLFKKNRDLFYYYKNYSFKNMEDIYKYARLWVGFRNRKIEMKFGDFSENFGQTVHGRGISLKYKFNHHIVKLNAAKNPITPTIAYGTAYEYISRKNLNFGLSGSYKYNDLIKNRSTAGMFFTQFKLLRNQNFSTSLAVTEEYRYLTENEFTNLGFGYGFGYNANYNKVRTNFRIKYGDRKYAGALNGRMEIRGQVTFPVNNRASSYIHYIRNRYSPAIYVHDSLMPEYISDFEQTRLDYSFLWTPQLYVSLTPIFERQSSNSFLGLDINESFNTHYYSVKSSVRFKDANSFMTFSPSIRFGINRITQFSDFYKGENVKNKLNLKPYSSAIFAINLNTRNWGFYISYYYGPNSINQQFNYIYNKYFTKTIRIMPYYERFIYKDRIRIISRANYLSLIDVKSNRINFSNELNFYVLKSFSLSFLSTFAYQTTYDAQIDETYKYSSSYFEVRIKNAFGFPQPRLKYHDLSIIFFKDINGNRVKEDNEPGIKNVLVNFVRNEEIDDAESEYEYQGEFSNVELLSDQKGLISYQNIPEGTYQVEFHSLNGGNENFTAEANNLSIKINKEKTIFVPFFENNKIFGKVVMNRSKLSNLGIIDISNLKVTATDRNGRVTSTLTDKNGSFFLYVPDVDKYNVKINNIFYENFDLQQNNFEVQLNGYKQFELTYVFTEKRRRIRFSSEYEIDQDMESLGLEIVRRTNLKGSIRDATNQEVIKADIKIIDKDNNVVSATSSDVINGMYNLSFHAGEDYRIIVTADDYWFYLEKLYERQITTFQNIQKDVLMNRITIGQVIPLNKLLFDDSKADLISEATAELDRLLEVLKNNPSVRISIHGHADDLEVLEVGAEIATERAKMVAKYLIANGYSRIEYVGHGNTMPVAGNDNAEDRQKNRRVNVIVKNK